MTLKGISKSFGAQRVLHDFSLEIAPGQTTCLMGASGAGKTTVLNIALGLIHPDEGQLLGFEGLTKSAVFQEDRLIEHMSALGNVQLVAPRGESFDESVSLLKALGLREEVHKRVSRMSGGERRRVAIARALRARPDLLVLDEPFKGLDEAARINAAALIQKTLPGATVLMVTHDREEARMLSADAVIQI